MPALTGNVAAWLTTPPERPSSCLPQAGCTRYSRPTYFLRYKRDGQWRVVMIGNAYSVAHARMLAAALAPGQFIDGYRVSPASVERLPRDAVGRVLTFAELRALAGAKKKPPAPSLRRPRGAGSAGSSSPCRAVFGGKRAPE